MVVWKRYCPDATRLQHHIACLGWPVFLSHKREETMHVLLGAHSIALAGPAETFTGLVWMETLVQTDLLSMSVYRVSFAPGARTAWHTHPHGQTLIITSGNGLVQQRSGQRQAVRAGDVVVIGPGEEHWHGAAPESMMQHIAICTT